MKLNDFLAFLGYAVAICASICLVGFGASQIYAAVTQ